MTAAEVFRTTPDVEVHFLNVGQGDATLMVDRSEGVAAVIDCNREGERSVEALLKGTGANLEAVFISHFHADHFDAIPNIVSRRETTAVYCNHSVVHLSSRDQRAQVRAFKRWLADEKTKGRPRDTVGEGDSGSVGVITWECWAPNIALLDSAEGNSAENRASIVLLLRLPTLRILVGADADAEVWKHILTNHAGPVDVLRIPHHGGAIAPAGQLEAQDVLDTYRPKFRIVSVGTVNRYGHADPRWLKAREHEGRVLCTQVTKACHRSSLSGPRPCAGDVTIQWWRSGEWRVLPEVTSHLPIVDSWDHPQCRPTAQ